MELYKVGQSLVKQFPQSTLPSLLSIVICSLLGPGTWTKGEQPTALSLAQFCHYSLACYA